MKKQYKEFLEKKIVVAKEYGFEIDEKEINEKLLPHQKDIVKWAIGGGRRAIFASFGLGKTIMQLEIARQVMNITGKPFLVCMPLGVVGEFKDDLEFLYPEMKLEYITDSDVLENTQNWQTPVISSLSFNRIFNN